jgi:hypothetical protein
MFTKYPPLGPWKIPQYSSSKSQQWDTVMERAYNRHVVGLRAAGGALSSRRVVEQEVSKVETTARRASTGKAKAAAKAALAQSKVAREAVAKPVALVAKAALGPAAGGAAPRIAAAAGADGEDE